MNSCFYGKPNFDFENIIKHWNSKKVIRNNIGKVGGRTVKDIGAEMYLNDVSEHLFKIPFNSSFKFSEGMVNRMKLEIDHIENNYKTAKINSFRKYFYVSEAIADYSPVTRMFYERVNGAINYERNHIDFYIHKSKQISEDILQALVSSNPNMSRKQARKYQKDLADLQVRIQKGNSTPEEHAALLTEYQKAFDENGSAVTGDYIKLMELNKADYRKEILSNQGRYNTHILNAVDNTRTLLDRMGKVVIKGLESMTEVVKLTYGDNPIVPTKAKNYIDRITKAIKAIQIGIEEGGYLPHYLLDHLVEANQRISKLAETKNAANVENSLGNLTTKVESMLPDIAKGRNPMLNNIWSKNPFYIVTQYAKDAIAFNKINEIQKHYIPAMRKFQRGDVNPEFIKSMRTYLEDTFQIATRGLGDRPDWVNGTVRILMAAETLKAMGLSVTGSIRNGASAAYFFTESGLWSAKAAIADYNGDHKLKEIITRQEQEQGFEFKEGANELIAEGLVPSTTKNSDLSYDPLTNKITYRDGGVFKTLDPMIDKVVGKSLMLHRLTENFTRKWMFRIAWVQSYKTLKNHHVIDPSNFAQDSKFESRNTRKIENMATRFALKAVNTFAFEYAGHAKARAIGGTAPRELGPDGKIIMHGGDYATAAGELAFQFMHYPMSFLNLQSKILRGAKDAALSGQYDAPELKQALRFAGIYGMVGALSVGFNIDFTNTLENDTVERLKEIRDYLTLDDKELEEKGKRGLISDFSGPIVGDIQYALNMFQLTSMPEEKWKKVLNGYIDYYAEGQVPDWVDPKKKLDSNEKRHMWNKLSTQWNRIYTKDIPAIRDGRGIDVLRHELGWYPRQELKDTRKKINIFSKKHLGFKPFKDKKKDGKANLARLLSELNK